MGWCGVHSHFHVQPNLSIDVLLWLCYVVVGVVTIFNLLLFKIKYWFDKVEVCNCWLYTILQIIWTFHNGCGIPIISIIEAVFKIV